MTNSPLHHANILSERYALRIAGRLSDGADALDHEVVERLRAAREQALAARKREPVVQLRPALVSVGGGTLAMGNDERLGWWGRLASVLPVVTLVIGLFVVNQVQNDYRAQEVADVDAALLTDDLPPAAYADPGFVQFLKVSTSESAASE